MGIHYNRYSINPKWEDQIRNNDRLSKESKREIIWGARFDTLKDNALELLWAFVKLIISALIFGAIALLISLFNN